VPELWGGIESTVNRVGDRFFDQLRRGGHHDRLDDLDALAESGISAVRYPVLWERAAHACDAAPSWGWSDTRLERLRELAIRPIVGLLHHGSGPWDTNLTDPRFPEAFAEYAHLAARRYPWVTDWTPINEPLTTARFSGLYGHWYPHGRDDETFVRTLLHQCCAIVRAMRAIRSVNTRARYVHTDDGGTTFSTPTLASQADFDNRRRDLAIDLVSGRVGAEHPMYRYLRDSGASVVDLSWLVRHGQMPDVLGINYYATSDRFLDHRVERYPEALHGGNGRLRYADVAGASASVGWTVGFARALERTWCRYRRPVALTEVHLGCTREEQLRWLAEAWEQATTVEKHGVPVEAFTVWSMFGAYDWNSLVTRDANHYEPGAFDVRAPTPRRTALFGAMRSLAATKRFDHPVLGQPGWWQRAGARPAASPAKKGDERSLLILGSSGTLGAAFVRQCAARGIDHVALTRRELDIARAEDVHDVVSACRPWAVINATGYVRVDDAEEETEACTNVNTAGALTVAEACERGGAALISFSSDLVFGGDRQSPYRESDRVNPLSVYGRSKADAERGIRERMPSALIVRTSAFFGPWDPHNFLASTLRSLDQGLPVRATTCVVTPTYVPALVDASLDLLIDGETGIWHLTNRTATSWVALARLAATEGGRDASLVEETTGESLGWRAPRPAYSALGSERGELMPTLEDSLHRFLATVAL
jgi:dTDP-4-dehydrorhamnose reductase